jgi:hypothetical protein
MSAISQDARAYFQAGKAAAEPISVRSAVVLWLASSALLWAGIIQALRTLV